MSTEAENPVGTPRGADVVQDGHGDDGAGVGLAGAQGRGRARLEPVGRPCVGGRGQVDGVVGRADEGAGERDGVGDGDQEQGQREQPESVGPGGVDFEVWVG